MNRKNFIEHLKGKTIYLLSPHFDDAVLSTSTLLCELVECSNITVINIFTKANNGPYTLSGLNFLNAAGFKNANELFEHRRKEDRNTLFLLKINFINFNLTDSLFRRKRHTTYISNIIPEFAHLYPTYHWHILRCINPFDWAMEELEQKLVEMLPKDAILFSPAGIGNHVDHRITRLVCEKISRQILYYVDFPYNLHVRHNSNPPVGYAAVESEIDYEIKSKLVRHYSSQIHGLFSGGIMPHHKEKFFVPQFMLKIPVSTQISQFTNGEKNKGDRSIEKSWYRSNSGRKPNL